MRLVDHEAGFVHLILQLPHELLKGFRCPLLDARLHHFDATLHAPQLFFAFELPMDVVRPAPDLFLLHVIVHVLVLFEVQVVAILDTFHRHAAALALLLCVAGEPRRQHRSRPRHAHEGSGTRALLPGAGGGAGGGRCRSGGGLSEGGEEEAEEGGGPRSRPTLGARRSHLPDRGVRIVTAVGGRGLLGGTSGCRGLPTEVHGVGGSGREQALRSQRTMAGALCGDGGAALRRRFAAGAALVQGRPGQGAGEAAEGTSTERGRPH
mmetsp:Transcript_145316/g.465597  ORF Transcript_145316/g.465597 Transcript_145316/m.465597 type:complete len:265 (+) Transcript_145316:532-1326(+)